MLDGIFADNKKPRILIVDYIMMGMNWPNPRSTCPWWSEKKTKEDVAQRLQHISARNLLI